MLLSTSLSAAGASQTFYLATSARAGKVQLPRGICEVTWNAGSGPRVMLTIKTDDEKTVRVAARMVGGKQNQTGVVTSVVNGVTYLQELHTQNAKFIFQNERDTPK
jgi:outer membrane usher protein FimD/PapC